MQMMNRSRGCKKKGLLKKFKGGTSDQSDSNVKKSIKNIIINDIDGYP
jgi:hypothetical protein